MELRRSTRLSAKHGNEVKDEGPIKKKAKSVLKDKVNTKEPVKKPNTKEEKVSSDEAILEVGDDIPDITLQNQDGKDVSLKALAKENKVIIIFLYPKASTPGCTRQACGFRDNFDDLKEHGLVLGLSHDTPAAQLKFKEKYSLPYDLLCDPTREFIGMLGAKKTPASGSIRSHFVFADGKLKFKRLKISPEISVADGKKEVLELAKQYSN